MKGQVGIALVTMLCGVASTRAMQQPPTTPPAKPGPAIEQPRSQMPTLGRPTKPEDATPVLDFGLFLAGRWDFEWDFPDSALGPADSITGSISYKAIDDRFFEAVTDGKSSTGPVRIREVIGYVRDRSAISRHVTDSRGYSYLQMGTVGGDLGGQFTINLDSAPFTFKGKTVRLRSVLKLLSPLNYRLQASISEDGGPFTNYGMPWFKKDPRFPAAK